MDNVECEGTEKSLQDCKFDFDEINCKHDKDVYIKCDEEEEKKEEKKGTSLTAYQSMNNCSILVFDLNTDYSVDPD